MQLALEKRPYSANYRSLLQKSPIKGTIFCMASQWMSAGCSPMLDAKEPLIIGLFCAKEPLIIKGRSPMLDERKCMSTWRSKMWIRVLDYGVAPVSRID